MAMSAGTDDAQGAPISGAVRGGRQHTVILRVRGESSRDANLRAVAALEGLSGVRRVLLDEASQAVIVRGTLRPAALRQALSEAKLQSTVVRQRGTGRSAASIDHVALALLIFAAQIALTIWTFGIEWPLLPALQAGASMFVIFVLGASIVSAAAVSLAKLRFGLDLALTIGACAAWWAGALSMIRLEQAGQPHFLIATLIIVCGLLGHAFKSSSRAAAGMKLQRLLQLMPEKALVERRRGATSVSTNTLRSGQIVHVETGARFPADGIILSGGGAIDERAISGSDSPFFCGVGDAVLAGSVNVGNLRQVKITCPPRDASVTILARMAAETDLAAVADIGPGERVAGRFFIAVLIAAAVTGLILSLGSEGPLAGIETALLMIGVGTPASIALARPLTFAITLMVLRRWGIWARDPAVIELAGAIGILAISPKGIMTEGVQRVSKTTSTSGDQYRALGLAAAVLDGSDHQWAEAIHQAAIRSGADERSVASIEALEDDGAVAVVRDGERSLQITLGSVGFLALRGIEINPNFIDTTLQEMPEAVPVFVAVDGHPIGAVWLTDPIRQTAQSAIRSLRGGGVETCLLGAGPETALAQTAGAIGTDSYALTEDSAQLSEEIKAMRASRMRVAMVGHPVRDAAGMAVADLSIGFGALDSPAAARPGFLLRHAEPLLVSTCFSAARVARARLWQSLIVAQLPILAAVIMTALQMMTTSLALVMFGVGIAAVLINSARMLIWRPRFLSANH